MFDLQSAIFNVQFSIFNVMAFLPSEHRLRSGTIGNVVSIQIFYYVAFMPSEQRLMTSPGSSPLLLEEGSFSPVAWLHRSGHVF